MVLLKSKQLNNNLTPQLHRKKTPIMLSNKNKFWKNNTFLKKIVKFFCFDLYFELHALFTSTMN